MTTPTIDEARVEEFAGRLMGTFNEAMVTVMIDIATTTGLTDALTQGPGTSPELADRAGLEERYVRECLGALVTGGVVEFDDTTDVYSLPIEHAVCLTGGGSLDLSPLSSFTRMLAGTAPDVAEAFRRGGGVPADRFRADFTDLMDALSRGVFDDRLVDDIVPMAAGLPETLESGAYVADIACGTGHSTNLLAKAYPESSFVGYDISTEAIEAARAEADELGLDNVAFEVRDVTTLPTDRPFQAVFGFDAIHDQVDPAAALSRVHESLEPGGVFTMVDIKASSHLADNVQHPLGPWLYGISTLYCLTISLAERGEGLGTVWGEQLARRMLAEAGFVDVETHDVPDDPTNMVFVAQKAD